MRGGARQLVEIAQRDRAPRTVRIDGLDARTEHAHGHRHVTGVGRDAGLTDADDCQLPAVAAKGRAAAAGLALVAGLVGVVEIRAAGALEQVATRGSLVPQLPGSTRDDRAGEHAVVAPNALVCGQVGVAYQRSDAQPSVRGGFNLVEAEAVYVDEMLWRFDLELHQVEQVGASRDEFGVRVARRRSRCFGG